MLSVLAAVVLAQVSLRHELPDSLPDGGLPIDGVVETAVIRVPGLKTDAGVIVRGGCWLERTHCINTGKKMTELKAENAELKKFTPALAAVVLVFGLGFGAGLAAGHPKVCAAVGLCRSPP